MSKNKWGKRVPKEKAYYTFTSAGWTYRVLKVYGDPRKDFARAFCLVESPAAPYGDLGDAYCREVPGLIAAWVAAHEEG